MCVRARVRACVGACACMRTYTCVGVATNGSFSS